MRAPPPAARHYLHEDPEKQGSDPDLDGQFSHGAAGAAPAAAAAGAVRGSPAARPAPALQTRGGKGGALQAAGGGGGRAPEGRAGGGEGSAQTSCLRLRGSGTPRWPLPRSRPRAEDASGTPRSPALGTASAS